jgi:hypothetical protein
MKRLAILILFIGGSRLSFAQDATILTLKSETEKNILKNTVDTTFKKWKKGGLFNVNINQGSLNNWSAGGDKFSFSLNTYLNLFAFYKKEKKSWDNTLDLAFGIVKTTSLGLRKSNDRIEYTSKFGYGIHKKVNAATLFNSRSQFANGYSYSKNAQGIDTPTLTSKPLTPTYLLVSVGFDYKPVKQASLFFSPITSRWIVVNNVYLGKLYGVDSGKVARSELGAFLSANLNTKIGKSFTYKTKMDLFSNYKKNPKNIDVFWTNVITAKISKRINFSFNVDMIYDDDTKNTNPNLGPAPQWLQLMGIGFAYNFTKK